MLHLRKGAPDVPVCLFSTVRPLPETAALCQSVTVHGKSAILFLQSQIKLWRYRVALSVCPWTGTGGHWPVKLAPFLIPPFRALILNENRDFLAASASNVMDHIRHRVSDSAAKIWNGIRNLASDAHFWLAAQTLRGGLQIVSSLLRFAGYPNRTRFDRLHGNDTLQIETQQCAAEGVAVFRQGLTRWDGARLEKFTRSTSARWILWTEGPTPKELARSGAWMNATDVFALSQQMNAREWKAMMFATAPFRALPPGAACQLLAPVSNAILVDRAKLLALGIPRTTFSTTAWMILFWRAAAAGWRSFSIGGTAAIAEQKDFPLQEASFVLRLLADSGLRKLGPHEPQLSRGATCFSPALHARNRGEHGKLRVLLVSPFLPYPLSHGGAVRIFNLCRALSERVDFTLLAIREKGETVDFERLGEVFRQVYVVDIDERASTDPELPGQVRGYQSGALRALIARVVREWKPDLLQIEYTHMAAYADAASEVPAILVEHDVTFELYRQLAESQGTPAATEEYRRWLEFEKRWLARYAAVWTVSEQDRTKVVEASGRSPEATFVVENGVDVRRFTAGDEDSRHPVVFYVGSFRHLPNVLGFNALVQQVMPGVWQHFPEARLCVVAGANPERYQKQQTYDTRIEVLAFVEDLRPLYARAAVVVVPLEVSAGTNIKVLEAMACGKAIVSTPVGCTGLGLRDGVEILIREGWNHFADAVCGILSGETPLLGAQARRAAESRFSWVAIADEAFASYERAAGAGIPRPGIAFQR